MILVILDRQDFSDALTQMDILYKGCLIMRKMAIC